MMLRLVAPDDTTRLVQMGEAFYASGEIFGGFSASSFLTFWHDAIMKGKGFILIAEENGEAVGSLGALLYDHPNNSDVRVAQEMFWWMEEAFRGSDSVKLITAFEDLAREWGATVVSMSAINGMRERAIGRIYERWGYRPQEVNYVKEL